MIPSRPNLKRPRELAAARSSDPMLPRELTSAARSSSAGDPLQRDLYRGRAPLPSASLLLTLPPSTATPTSVGDEDAVDFLSDLFSQAPSHQPPSHHLASQGSSHGGSVGDFFNPGMGTGLLDLNSNAESFPDLASYNHLLQLDEPATRALPPIGPGRKSVRGRGRSQSLNIGGASSSRMRPFVPPGAAASAEGSMSQVHRGGSMSQGTRGIVGRARASSSAGIGGRGFSMSQGAELEDVGEHDELEDGEVDDNSGDGSASSSDDEDTLSASSSDDEDTQSAMLVIHQKRKRRIMQMACMIGMFYLDSYSNKGPYRVPIETGYDWVMPTLGHRTSCYEMFRMHRPVFEKLHSVLLGYGLKSTKRMSSIEALAPFLWIVGSPQSVRQAKNRFVRSLETIVRKFDKVLACLIKLSKDIIRPTDPHFTAVHSKLRSRKYAPYMDHCIGAIDGTHIQVVVPLATAIQHRNRHKEKSQNVMCVCDFDMRFTFVLAGWPGSVHDMRVFHDAQNRFGNRFPKPPPQKFYLVDSGYTNRPGYLAPYKCLTYHFQEYRDGTMPRGKKEHFNFSHSSLRNVIERSFGVLKNKWRILFNLPSYPQQKQSKIIGACIALHNFIRESQLADIEFDLCDQDENYVPLPLPRSSQIHDSTNEMDSAVMNQFRDWVADGLWSLKQQ